MKRFYALIPLSNVDCENRPLLPEQPEKLLICTWTENILNDWVSDATNTNCVKTVTELVTGIRIHPEPDEIKALPTRLEFDCDPHISTRRISKEKAMELLEFLKSDPESLKAYVSFIKRMQIQVRAAKAEEKRLVKEQRTSSSRKDIKQLVKEIREICDYTD